MSYTEHNNNMLSPDMGEAGRTHARVFVGPPYNNKNSSKKSLSLRT